MPKKPLSNAAWYYGPKGQAQVFEDVSEVPEGWTDHPSKQKDYEEPRITHNPGDSFIPPPTINPGDVRRDARSENAGDEGGGLDSDGHVWDSAIHLADKTKTADGKWRLKPGQSRPEPKPAQPLDL